MKRTLIAAVTALAIAPLSACVVRVREPGAYEYVQVAPPAPQVEVMGVAPGPNHFWVAGHWYWAGGRYAWRPGYWEARRPGHEWVMGHWDHRPGHGHYWVEGRWR
jgi:hypothetical protein